MDCTYPGCRNGLESGHVLMRWDGDNQFYCLIHFPGEPDPMAMVVQQANLSRGERSFDEALADAGYYLQCDDRP